jgi:hypothetical protein
MAALFQSGTFTSILDLMQQLDTWLVNVAGYTRNMAPGASDSVFGTGYRAHYQFTRTTAMTPGDTRQLFFNLKGLTAMLNSGTYVSDGLTANLSDGYSAAQQWHNQPGYPAMRGAGLSANASFVSSRIAAGDVTAKPYDFYTDGIGNVVLLYATMADGLGSSWSTNAYQFRHGLIFGFLDDTGCGTGFTATGGTAGTFIYGKQTSGWGTSYNGLIGNQDLHLGCVNDNNNSYVLRPTFIVRVKSAGYDGWASSVNNQNTGCGTGFTATGGTAGTFIYGKQTSGWGTSYNGLIGNQDLHLGCVNDNNNSYVLRPTFIVRVKSAGYDGWASSVNNQNTGLATSRLTALNKASSGTPGWVTDYFASCDISASVYAASYPGSITYDIDNSTVNGFFPMQWMSHNAQFNPQTGKFFGYQPCWFVRDEATLRWFPVGRFPLVYQQRTDTTNILPNPGSITVAGQAYDVRGPLWIKKITV